MIKIILIGFGVVVLGLLVLAALKPTAVNITREVVISATPEQLFPYINNTKKSYEWMPWAEGDPGVEIKYSGPEEGLGSSSSWNGKQMGVGTSEVVESVPNQHVRTKLVYTKPFEMSQVAVISLIPDKNGTIVRWSVDGHSGFFFRLIGVFFSIDKQVGNQFTKGLNKLKEIAEK